MKGRILHIVILFLIVFLGTSFSVEAQTSDKMLSVRDVVSIKFKSWPKKFQWLPRGEAYSYIKTDNEDNTQQLWKHQAASGEETLMVDSEHLTYTMQNGDTRQISLMNYIWFPNQSELLLLNEGDIWHYQLNEEKLIRLTNTEAVEEEADISPKGKSVSFIRENDLYVMNLDTGEERQLTTEGSETILNGKLDWVYQEELVGRGIFRGYFWSPKSDKIAYLRFDTSNIPEYPLVDWRPYHPEVENMRYPKAGDPNSTVKLGVVSIDNSETVWMDTGEEKAVYFPRVYWLPDGKTVAFMRLDRLQQHLELLFADANTGESRVILEERDPYWINLGDYVHFFKNKDRFLWGSERSGYNHLYLYNYEGKVVKQLTGGEWLVDKLAGVNEIDGWIYFTATKKDLRERHVYRVNTGGDKFERISDRCGVHEIKMAATGKFYADKFSSTERPSEVTLHRGSGDLLETIVGDDQNLPRKFAISEPEFLTFTGDKGITYYARIIKPPDFDPGKKYPMLIYTYGGPHGQVVQNKFGGLSQKWHLMLAQRGYIIFSMDNRGAYGRGHAWETPIYQQLGKIELQDQLRGVAYLKTLPYVDNNRIGIWGWSYGGYMTLYALTHSDVFRTGISVAPVTDWRNYDTAYTERYMGLPQNNQRGYRNSSPVNAADNLHGKLLLVHGTADDNVHLQNAIHMVDHLIDAGQQFQLMVYPNKKHGIDASADRLHLVEMMTDFLEENLK